MDNIKSVRALTILEAARLTASGDLENLEQLLSPCVLKFDHILRILLTYLPKGIDPNKYTKLLQTLSSADGKPASKINPSTTYKISDTEAYHRVQQLHLQPLDAPQYPIQDADSLTLFLIHQSYNINADTGSLTLVAQLLEPFLHHSETLQTWMISVLLPLLRMEYDYYPHSASQMSLSAFGEIEDALAIQTLLSHALHTTRSNEKVEISRDMRGLVGPWMYGEHVRKKRKLTHGRQVVSPGQLPSMKGAMASNSESQNTGWSYVNERLLDLGSHDLEPAAEAFLQWNGPSDVDYGDWGTGLWQLSSTDQGELTRNYAQLGMALVYGTERSTPQLLLLCHQILKKVSNLMGLEELPEFPQSNAPTKVRLPSEFLHQISPQDILHNVLLRVNNPLTTPTSQSIQLLNFLISSTNALFTLGNPKSVRDVARLCLLENQENQSMELQKTLLKASGDKSDSRRWFTVRDQILWLHSCNEQLDESGKDSLGVFSRIRKQDIETEVFKAILKNGGFAVASRLYCEDSTHPLPQDMVECIVLEAAFSAYDAASNGNRTRGGVKKASEIISAFQTFFPSSQHFKNVEALIAATHAMSFYTLTLQHGVPFQPVNIRAYKDPITLIEKILSQNPRSYTHLDDLLTIGQNLVNAGLCQPEIDALQLPSGNVCSREVFDARRRITRMAIEEALAEDDFDTAYSYVINRLSLADQTPLDEIPSTRDDISWRAAYAAGRYPTSNSGRPALRRLEQRMELLSQALLLAPPPALTEILTVWQQCEQQMADLVAVETAEEEQWDEKGEQKLPGSFTTGYSPAMSKVRDPSRGALLEEAPMGLFEVARGAASALSKNAFPLRSGHKPGDLTTKGDSQDVRDDEDDVSGAPDEAGRVRKRDMVSNMVTGGLVSGIGWVIGAPPVRQE